MYKKTCGFQGGIGTLTVTAASGIELSRLNHLYRESAGLLLHRVECVYRMDRLRTRFLTESCPALRETFGPFVHATGIASRKREYLQQGGELSAPGLSPACLQ